MTEAAGLATGYVGESWGVAWGDADGDGWPDLWVTNHASAPALYMNQGDGTFREESAQRLLGLAPDQDQHGSAWADFDNDGDQDLFVIAGARQGEGAVANQLWVFEGGQATEQAAALGVDLPEGRGRVPVWVDADADGWLDLVLVNERRDDGLAPTALMSGRGAAGFAPADESLGFEAEEGAGLAQLASLDGRLSIVLGDEPYPQPPLALSGGGLSPSPALAGALETSAVHDALFGELGCDGAQDAVLLRGWGNGVPEVYQPEPDTVWAALAVGSSLLPPDAGFDLEGVEALSISLEAIPPVEAAEVFIGASGRHPADAEGFELRASSAGDQGLVDYAPGEDAGLYLGYDAGAGLWRARLSGDTWRNIGVTVRADQPVAAAPFQIEQPERSPRVVSLAEPAAGQGFAPPSSCAYGALGDFDNDMDLDVYLSCAAPTHNEPNQLWLNRGDGSFERADDIGDAAQEGAGGRSGAPAVADYDGDGSLDLYLSNARADDTGFNRGSQQLLRNRGGDKHWLAVGLLGAGPLDAIGSTLTLEAGGVTQVRHQLGGLRSGAQDHARVHFGLGENAVADALTVTWPDGQQQTFTDLDADQVLTLTQATP